MPLTLRARARLIFLAIREILTCRRAFIGVNKGCRFGTCHFVWATSGANHLFKRCGRACTRRHQDGRAAIHWLFFEIQHGKEAGDWVLEEVPGSFAFVRFTSRPKAKLVTT